MNQPSNLDLDLMDAPPATVAPAGRAVLEWGLIIAFLLPLVAPGFATLMGVKGAGAEAGQGLARAPEWPRGTREWFDLPRLAKEWFRDHFAFRHELVHLHGVLSFNWLGIAKDRRVMVGRDKWLFYVEDPSRPTRSATPLSPTEVDQWVRVLEQWNAGVTKSGAKFVVVLCPDKQSIYPEALPAWARVAAPNADMPATQVVNRLKARGTVAVADLRAPMMAAKADGPLYYRADSHWNELGAAAAFKAVFATIGAKLNLGPTPPLIVTEVPGAGGDLARFLGIPDDVPERWIRARPRDALAHFVGPTGESETLLPVTPHAWLVTERRGGPIPRAVVFRDSFLAAMLPHMAELFGHALYLWQPNVDLAVVERERPDIVIFQLVERALRRPPPAVEPSPTSGTDPKGP